MKHSIRLVCATAALVLGLAGCATEKEPEFGSSVRHMIIGQKYDPAAPTDTMGAVDAKKATQAIDTYHGVEKKAPATKAAGSTQ